jgi:hypothetical protein
MALLESKIATAVAALACAGTVAVVALAATSGLETVRTLLGREPNLSATEAEIHAAKPALPPTPTAQSASAPTPPGQLPAKGTPAATRNVPAARLEVLRAPDASRPPGEPGSTDLADAQGGASGPAELSAPPAQAAPSASNARAAPAPAQEQCGDTLCPPGKVCCNASCGTCAAPGETCSQLVCGMSPIAESAMCGFNTCNVGERCCNPSCGICVRPGEECDAKRTCNNPIQYPVSVVCGMATCNAGMICCNPSCALCAAPGEPCSQKPCG